MLLGGTEEEMNAWKTEMRQYEKAKRTKKPFGPEYPTQNYITHKDIKTRETEFNPVLQTFQSSASEATVREKEEQKRAHSLMNHMKNTQKYEKPYDIINLYSDEPQRQAKPKMLKAPLRNNYDIVSNQPLPDFYMKNRDIRIPLKPQRKLLKEDTRQYNIITGNYKVNNEQKTYLQEQKHKQESEERYWQTHDYNPVIGTYYDINKQEHYQEQLEKQMKQHGKDAIKKLPPSYIYRQRYIADPTKEVPEEIKQIEQKTKNAKKRYEMRYAVERQYADRNIEYDNKQETILRNKVHEGKILEDQKKQFNIITMKPYNMQEKLKAYGKSAGGSTWDKIMKGQEANRFEIKTSGFS